MREEAAGQAMRAPAPSTHFRRSTQADRSFAPAAHTPTTTSNICRTLRCRPSRSLPIAANSTISPTAKAKATAGRGTTAAPATAPAPRTQLQRQPWTPPPPLVGRCSLLLLGVRQWRPLREAPMPARTPLTTVSTTTTLALTTPAAPLPQMRQRRQLQRPQQRRSRMCRLCFSK